MTGNSGIVTAFLVLPGIVHYQPERPVTIDQNRRSRWARTSGHVGPEYPLFPNEKPLADVFKAEFEGMTMDAVELDELLSTRRRMLEELPRQLLPRHCDFLLSMVRAEPDWSLLPYAHLRQLPALQWKLSNLNRLKRNEPKFQLQYDELRTRFETARG